MSDRFVTYTYLLIAVYLVAVWAMAIEVALKVIG